jgi:hypothetical protein
MPLCSTDRRRGERRIECGDTQIERVACIDFSHERGRVGAGLQWRNVKSQTKMENAINLHARQTTARGVRFTRAEGRRPFFAAFE